MEYSLAKIANELGLSKATVSFVLNGKARQARISTEVEDRVKKFCEEVNYVPNIHAQRINQKFVKNIGFLVNQSVKIDGNNPFEDYNISGIMGGIVLAAENAGCRVSVQLYNEEMNENRVFEWLRNHEIDGLIYYGLNIPEKWKKIFTDEERCVAGIGIEPDDKISSVNIDNFKASEALTQHLIDSGRKKFLYLSGIDGSFVSDERKRGFLSACRKSKTEQSIFSAEFSELKAEKLIYELKPDADAIVCANDDMAIGTLMALKKLGVSVSGQIAVAGADDIITGRYLTPSLTTFSNKQYELGEAAAECVLKMIRSRRAESIVIPSNIIIRKSTD